MGSLLLLKESKSRVSDFARKKRKIPFEFLGHT